MIGSVSCARFLIGEIISNGIRKYKIAVGKALHQSTGTELVCAMIGEIGFSGGVKSRNIGLKIIINPKSAHGIMNSRENSHWPFVGNFSRNILVHIEEISILRLNRIPSITF